MSCVMVAALLDSSMAVMSPLRGTEVNAATALTGERGCRKLSPVQGLLLSVSFCFTLAGLLVSD